ncbi:MAG: ABC transporter permease [Clostridia bacterium]|nr:ABC transporter permease [Clostridia bacterium]
MIFTDVLKYYKSNMRRFIAIFATISLSVLLVYVFQMLINSLTSSVYLTQIEPRKHFSIVRQKELLPDEKLINDIKARDETEEVLPLVLWSTGLNMIIGGDTQSDIAMLKEKDMDYLLSVMGMKIFEGRKPAPGRHEILLHERVAANKKLKIGDQFGALNSKNEWMSGSYRVVGLVRGKPVMSFAPYETAFSDYKINYEYQFGAAIIPKKGMLETLNKYLDSLPNTYHVKTYNSSKENIESLTGNIDLLITILSIIVMIIASVCVGFLCYIYFYQRRNEFGLLWAIGFSRIQVVNRVFIEISGMNLAGLIAGIIISVVFGWILRIYIYLPGGQNLYLFSLDSIIKALCVPLFATLFSIIPIWRMLRKLDPVSIIEGVM